LYGLEHNMPRLAEDHANARVLAEELARIDGVAVDLDVVKTNIVVFDVAATGRSPQDVVRDAAARGVLVVPFGPTRVRAVTHLDVSREDIHVAASILRDLLQGARSGSTRPHARAAA
jgi:threonine aldolase